MPSSLRPPLLSILKAGSMSDLIKKLKSNWLNVLLALIGLLSSADAAVGLRSGKSLREVSVMFSALVAAASSGTLGVKWLNGRTVVTRNVKQSMSPELWERLDNLFGLARDPDVSPDHASHLADMAGDLLLAENRRAKAEWLEKNRPVSVINVPAAKMDPAIAEMIRKTLGDAIWSVPPASPVQTSDTPKQS